MAVIEYARNVLNIKNANSTEFSNKINDNNKIIIFMPEIDKENMGGTMRLGLRECNIHKNSLSYYLYNKKNKIYERHRHRYEVNPKLINKFINSDLKFVGKDKYNERMEIIELDISKHPFFVACQFHPEFQSKPLNPSPIFNGFIKASANILNNDKLVNEYYQLLNKKNPYIDNNLVNDISSKIHNDSQMLNNWNDNK